MKRRAFFRAITGRGAVAAGCAGIAAAKPAEHRITLTAPGGAMEIHTLEPGKANIITFDPRTVNHECLALNLINAAQNTPDFPDCFFVPVIP